MNANTVVDRIPVGYRWATPVERQRSVHPAYSGRMVQVRMSPSKTILAIQKAVAPA